MDTNFEQEKEVMEAYYRELDLHYAEELRWNKRILNTIERVYGTTFLDEVKYELAESDAVGKLQITRVAYGRISDPDTNVIVNQTVNGGMTGDHFAGYLYIPLPGKRTRFLKSYYSM